MLFNSLPFLIFFPCVFVLYYALPFRFRKYMLLAASYYFYMCWKPEFIVLILFSTLVDYCCGLGMVRWPKRKKWLITIALFAGLIALVAFFFLRSFPLAELKDALKAVRPILLLPGFCLMFLFVLCEATASSRILAALGAPLPVRRCYTSSLLSFCCASITPSSSGGGCWSGCWSGSTRD